MDRAERICRAHLYVRSSHLKRYRQRRSRYEIPIGNGLFSSRDIPCNTHIVYFVGELLTDPVEIGKRLAQNEREDTLSGMLLRQRHWIATIPVCVDNVWLACPIAPSNVTIQLETRRRMTMQGLLTKRGATDIINGV